MKKETVLDIILKSTHLTFLTDESLYTATFSDFSGQTPVILRDSDQLRQDPSNYVLSGKL